MFNFELNILNFDNFTMWIKHVTITFQQAPVLKQSPLSSEMCLLSLFLLPFAACESAVALLFDAVMHLGCKPYLDSQRAACVCQYEVKKEL